MPDSCSRNLDTADFKRSCSRISQPRTAITPIPMHTVYQGSLSIAQGVDTLRTDAGRGRAGAADAQQRHAQPRARPDALLAQGYVSQQSVDAQATLVRNDQQALNTANANSGRRRGRTSQANGSLSGNGLQAAAVQQSQAQEQVALAQAEQVRVQIAKATIVSPIDGVVVNRNINPGEYPGNRRDLHAAAGQSDLCGAARFERTGREHRKRRSGDRRRRGSQRQRAIQRATSPASSTRSIPARLIFRSRSLLSNPGQRLRPGMVVQGNGRRRAGPRACAFR